MEALGPPAFNFCNKRFTRTDFTLRTKRGYNLECSHWEPIDRTADRIPVVIYMHGNSSARLEVIPQLSYLLSLGVAVFSFDFAGSGKSDGEYVSLGYYEREDLSCIVAHLRSTNVVSTIALWGRSMGAATALMFGDRDPSIACMILDSPFADLTQLCEEMVEKAREQGVVVPGIVASLAIRLIQSSVKKQAGFNIKNISPIAHADKCFIPVLFVAGEHDDFIKKHHSEALHAKYAGDKNLIIVEGDHNSPRPKFLFDSATIFLQTCMQIPNEWSLNVPISMNLMCPPWYFEIYEQRAAARRKQLQPVVLSNIATAASTTAATTTNASVSNTNKNPQFTVEMGVPLSRPLNAPSVPPQPQSVVTDTTTDSTAAPTATMNGYDHEEMGMTTERQRVIQASLFKMLGQADDDTAIAKSNK
jgi:pimeloyl-ACP methyl ester carboxylesterase